MSKPKTSKHRLYSDECGGEFTVHVTPSLSLADERTCGHKEPVKVKVTQGRKTVWAPDAPLCLSPMRDLGSVKGRRAAAEDALAFFEYDRCGRGRSSH